MSIAKLRKPIINRTTCAGTSDAHARRKDPPMIHAAIYYDVDGRKRR